MSLPVEIESRRPDWAPGIAVQLADGDCWHVPRAEAGEVPGGVGWLVNGRPASAGFLVAEREYGPGSVHGSHLPLVAELLRHNYDLTREDARRLLGEGGTWPRISAACGLQEIVNYRGLYRRFKLCPEDLRTNQRRGNP
jgi:hypothetical protein